MDRAGECRRFRSGDSSMSAAKLAMTAVAASLCVLLWQKHASNVEAAALAAVTDEHGFSALASPTGSDPRKVWVVAAVNCPKEGARRADELAERLAERNMSFDRRSNVSFSYEEGDAADIDRLQAIMNAETPIVFVNGRVKSNPDFDEVVAEYNAAQP
jgi:hypothetical protein